MGIFQQLVVHSTYEAQFGITVEVGVLHVLGEDAFTEGNPSLHLQSLSSMLVHL